MATRYIFNLKSKIQNCMTCPRCRVKMVEQKRSYHKQRKWICPKCGKARMQMLRKTNRGESE